MAKDKFSPAVIEESKAVEVIDSNFRALQVPAKQLVQTLQNNLGGAGLKAFDLDRVKVPSGGGIAWEVPGLKGPQITQTLEGIILHSKDNRSYWAKKYGGDGGGNQPPDCSSTDMTHGIGQPGGDCLRCAFAQFGSAIDQQGKPAKGQACKHVRLMLFLRADDMIPLLISVPPSSVKLAQKYFLRLAGANLPYQTVTTQLRLVKTRNAGGTEYAQIDFAMGRELREEEVAKAMAISAALREVFEKATVVEADVNGN